MQEYKTISTVIRAKEKKRMATKKKVCNQWLIKKIRSAISQKKIEIEQKLEKAARKKKLIQERGKTMIAAGKLSCRIEWINLKLMQ